INRTWDAAIKAGLKEYTFIYGKRLYDRAKIPADFKAAAAVLRQTPANHPAITHAKFYELSALQEVIDDKKLDPAVRKSLVTEIQTLAADVNKRIDADLAKAAPEQQPRLKFYKVSAILLAADLTQK